MDGEGLATERAGTRTRNPGNIGTGTACGREGEDSVVPIPPPFELRSEEIRDTTLCDTFGLRTSVNPLRVNKDTDNRTCAVFGEVSLAYILNTPYFGRFSRW